MHRKGYIYILVVMSINAIFAAVFLWILVNMVQSCAAFGCTNKIKNDTWIHNTDIPFCKFLAY